MSKLLKVSYWDYNSYSTWQWHKQCRC